MQHTHPEIKSPYLRSILANELLVLRASMRAIGESMTSDYVYGVRTGLDTFARRLQNVQERGVKIVYRQNYGVQGDAKGAGNEANIHE